MPTDLWVRTLVRDCSYSGDQASAWIADKLPPGADLDPELVRDILGARRRIIFVEGTAQSLDVPLYSLLFPGASVIPKGSCRDVEVAVKGLRHAGALHWVQAWGIVDNDQRSAGDIAKLKADGIWALPHYSVESLYYHSTVPRRLADRYAAFAGLDAAQLLAKALQSGLAEAQAKRDLMIEDAILRSARNAVMAALPGKSDVGEASPYVISIEIPGLRAAEEARFDKMVQGQDWDGLVARYPLRRSGALAAVVGALGVKDRATYEGAVLKLLADEPPAVEGLRQLLDGMFEAFAA